MERVRLTTNEKALFRRIYVHKDAEGLDMPKSVRRRAFLRLKELNFVSGSVNYDEIVNPRVTPDGDAYFEENPNLRNPFRWEIVTAISTTVAAIAATAAFITGLVACGVI